MYHMNFTEFIQNNGWYLLVFIIFVVYLVFNKLLPHYLKWSERRAADAFEAEIKKSKVKIHD